MRRFLLVLSAVVALGLLLPIVAHAHLGGLASTADVASRVDLPATVLHAAPPAATPLGVLLGLAAGLLVALGAIRYPQRVLVLALAVLLAVFAVEAGIHSVHHLGDRAVSACAVAAAAGHLTLGLDDGPPVVSRSLTPAGAVADELLASPVAPGLAPDLARAPPAPIA